MVPEQIKIGMKVKVISLETTHKRYYSNDEMGNMVGKIYEITSIHPDPDNNYPNILIVELNNQLYNWAPEDLIPVIHVGKKKEIKGGKFDVKNLVI